MSQQINDNIVDTPEIKIQKLTTSLEIAKATIKLQHKQFKEVNETLTILQKRFWKDRALMQEALEALGCTVSRDSEGQITVSGPSELLVDRKQDTS